jgi:hypothetical protein
MAYNGEQVASIPHVPVAQKTTVSTIADAAAVTFTPAQLLGGYILRDCNGAGRADVVPTGAVMIAAMPGAFVGQSFDFTIRNNSAGATTTTVTAAASGSTLVGTMTVAQNAGRMFRVVVTAIGPSPTYTLYSHF